MGELKVTTRTLTPLWTGGIDGTMDRIHETGIIGSLRWWYEAIVRGLGGEACDPTTHKCSFDADKYRNSKASTEYQRLREAGLCDVCQVFGATGWQQRFRVEVHPVEGEFDITEGMFPSGRIHPDQRRGYRVGGWMLHGGYFGTLELRFRGEEKVLLCEILPTLLFAEQWGALGPKTSIGYGVIKIMEIQFKGEKYRDNQGCWRKQLNKIVPCHCQESRVGKWWWCKKFFSSSTYQGVLPALTNMFFGKVRFEVKDTDWWKDFREIRWLQARRISTNEAHWTGSNAKPKGPYVIPNPLPASRVEHWVRCHKTFPLSPIVRTFLRYNNNSGVCKNYNGESDWCKFVFGTVQGGKTVCGYCGTKVIKDKNDEKRWWCHSGNVSLDGDKVFEGKRIQSKVRISWAYCISDNKWEFRVWGWLPEHIQNKNHQQKRREFLNTLKQSINNLPQQLSLCQPSSYSCYWIDGSKENRTFFKSLLEGCTSKLSQKRQ